MQRRVSSTVGRADAAAASSTSIVCAGSRASRLPSASFRLAGTRIAPGVRASSRPISSAKNGLPPDASSTRASSGRDSSSPSRSVSSRCSSPSPSGSSGSSSNRPNVRARSNGARTSGATRSVASVPTRAPSRRRSASGKTPAVEESSHWRRVIDRDHDLGSHRSARAARVHHRDRSRPASLQGQAMTRQGPRASAPPQTPASRGGASAGITSSRTGVRRSASR